MAAFYTCICQACIQMLSSIMIAHPMSGYDIQSRASIRDKCFTFVSFGYILLTVGPLRTGHMRALFSLAGSKHNLTCQFSFGINTKLLHHSTVLSIPSVVMMSSCCICFHSSLNFFFVMCSVHALGCLVQLAVQFCNENVPLKHQLS